MVDIECSLSDVKVALLHLRKALPGRRSQWSQSMIEIDVRPEMLSFSVIGAKYHVKASNGVFVKVIFPFILLHHMVDGTKGDMFSLICEVGRVRSGTIEYSLPTIQVVHPENQSTIDLTLNPTVIQILQLRTKYSSEELDRMGVLVRLLKAERSMADAIASAHSLLAPYGVKLDELNSLVDSKIDGLT